MLIGIGLIIFGLGKLLYPKTFRFYRMWEIFGKIDEPGQAELVLERLSGLILIIAGIAAIYKIPNLY